MEERKPLRGPSIVTVAVGVGLIALGGLWLLGQIVGIDLGHFLWPLFVIGPGVVLLVLGLGVRREAGLGLTIPGAIVTTTGLLLFYQNITGHWESWAYAWALIAPTSVGLAIMLNGALSRNQELVRGGRRTTTIGLILFAAFAVFFELIIGIGDSPARGIFLAAVLIGLGVVLLGSALLRKR